jgi:transposase
LLKHYPTPESIGTVSIDELTQVIKKVSRGRLGREVAARLQQVAATSLGTKEGRQGMLYEIDYILEQLDWVERKISAIAGKITEQLAQIPYAQKLLSIKGIGKVILAGIIGEVGDFRHYHKSSELIKLAGLDIYEISSGKYRGQRHISKCGRWLMRKLLYFASLNLVRNQGHMKEYYQRLVGQGMIKTKALIAVSRKLLSIMFAMVRDGTEYLGNESAANGASSSGATKIPA